MKNLVLQSTRDNVFAVANVAHSVFLYWVMRMQPLLAYWLHSEVDEGAQEKRSLLSTHPLILSSTHFYRSLLTSTDLYSIDEVAAQDKEGAIGSRQLSYDASREGFT